MDHRSEESDSNRNRTLDLLGRWSEEWEVVRRLTAAATDTNDARASLLALAVGDLSRGERVTHADLVQIDADFGIFDGEAAEGVEDAWQILCAIYDGATSMFVGPEAAVLRDPEEALRQLNEIIATMRTP